SQRGSRFPRRWGWRRATAIISRSCDGGRWTLPFASRRPRFSLPAAPLHPKSAIGSNTNAGRSGGFSGKRPESSASSAKLFMPGKKSGFADLGGWGCRAQKRLDLSVAVSGGRDGSSRAYRHYSSKTTSRRRQRRSDAQWLSRLTDGGQLHLLAFVPARDEAPGKGQGSC